MRPKISVIMPVYNCEKYVAEAIKSILNQTFKDIELIIVDGGSTDSTLSIAQCFRDIDHRLKVIECTGLGITESRNEGICQAQGKVIAFQDADDISHPDRLRRQYFKFRQDKNLAVLGTSYYLINEKGKIVGQKLLKEKITFEDFRKGMQLCNGSVMFRRDVVFNENLFDPLFEQCEDYELYCRLSKKGYKIANLNEFLYYLRVHKDSISSKKWQEQILYACLVKEFHFGKIEKVKMEQSSNKDHKFLYSILSPEAKKEFHLSIAQNFIRSKQYLKGLNEFLKIVRINVKDAAKLIVRAIQNPSRFLARNNW